ncbi:biotin-dependent carboxyltransferase family protein [Trinickia soli]|uniref:Allophanate hydrolase n=1 Tax=Trinickia soli TaxID=380675 RepID=A0A2N7W784_9BURK|nr:biotin-dependent carboxyltransferase family protein [Trinickia soli]PMS25266.1 allophanate hydrolase [Trinickia soli]CAB3687901.1 5-oxoprolinase subunit C [Trinickia soli]
MIEVLRAGVLSSVQDLGRTGLRHLGVAKAGVLDALALEVGNRLVGNPPQAAAIEVTVGPAAFRFNHTTRIAVTGAQFGATLDGEPVYTWWSLPVRAGQELVLQGPMRGMRGYLCVRGGVDVLPVLGSRSTDLAARFGGLGGRKLRDGDRLPMGALAARQGRATDVDVPAFGVKAPQWCRFAEVSHEPVRRGKHAAGSERAAVIRVLRGPEYDAFDEDARTAFWSDEWCVTPHSNRMGYRLAGSPLAREGGDEMLSHAVLPGTIQVPGNGQPIVLLADAQTTGGYPRIGVVIAADLWKLAQVRLGGAVRFVRSTREEARYALAEEHAYLRQIDAAIAMHEERLRRLPGRAHVA